jgi:hypothetical protein
MDVRRNFENDKLQNEKETMARRQKVSPATMKEQTAKFHSQ